MPSASTRTPTGRSSSHRRSRMRRRLGSASTSNIGPACSFSYITVKTYNDAAASALAHLAEGAPDVEQVVLPFVDGVAGHPVDGERVAVADAGALPVVGTDVLEL